MKFMLFIVIGMSLLINFIAFIGEKALKKKNAKLAKLKNQEIEN